MPWISSRVGLASERGRRLWAKYWSAYLLLLMFFLSLLPAEYMEMIKSGEKFESLASQFSDCSSAKNGGDLGPFGRGVAPICNLYLFHNHWLMLPSIWSSTNNLRSENPMKWFIECSCVVYSDQCVIHHLSLKNVLLAIKIIFFHNVLSLYRYDGNALFHPFKKGTGKYYWKNIYKMSHF